jgi:hypothetical protein
LPVCASSCVETRGKQVACGPSETVVALLVVVLPGPEEVELSLMIGPPIESAGLPARVVGLLERRARGAPVQLDELGAVVGGDERLVLVLREAVAVEVVAAGLRDGVMSALEDFSYSALKFCVTTRNSWTAFCGNGLPRLESWPTMPPFKTSFL